MKRSRRTTSRPCGRRPFVRCLPWESMYTPRLIEHFKNPRNVGKLGPPAITVEVANPACGDILRLSVRFEDGRVAEVRYKVRGCTASIAAGSALTEWIVGKSRGELAAFDTALIDEAVGGLPAASKHAAVLCGDGLKKLLEKQIEPTAGATVR